MDFIERIFHWSPDHGNGTLEVLILVSVLLVPVVFAVVRAAFGMAKCWPPKLRRGN
jgi:hypothetical protein